MEVPADELLRRITAMCPTLPPTIAVRQRGGRRSAAVSRGDCWAVLDFPAPGPAAADRDWCQMPVVAATQALPDDAPPAAAPPPLPEPAVWFPRGAVAHVLAVADTTEEPFAGNCEATWPPDAQAAVGLDEDGLAATDGFRHHRTRPPAGSTGFARTALVSAAAVASVLAACTAPQDQVGFSDRPDDRSPFGSLTVRGDDITLALRVAFHDSWMPDPHVDLTQLAAAATLPAAALLAQLDRYRDDDQVLLSAEAGSLAVSDDPGELQPGSGFVPVSDLRAAVSPAADPADATVELRWGPPGSVLWCRRGPLEATLRTSHVAS